MRYVISTQDQEGTIGAQIAKWQKDGKVEIIEKSETLVEIEAALDRVAKAINILNKAGYNSEVAEIFIAKKTGLGLATIRSVMRSQKDFLKQIGALK